VDSNISRNLARALAELTRITSQLRLPYSVKESAAHLYRRALAHNIIRGRGIEGVVAGCVYIACRFRRVPVTLKEVAGQSHLGRKELAHSSRILAHRLDLDIPVPQAGDYIPRFTEALELGSRVIRRALQIIDDARRELISTGKAPTGVAAACLYIACILEGEGRTQREIAQVAGVTEVTVRNRYKEIVDHLGITMKR
jgi:transcription initiation factor TFIIB